jgi:TolB-like protein
MTMHRRISFSYLILFFLIVMPGQYVTASQSVPGTAGYSYRSEPEKVEKERIDWLGGLQSFFTRRKAEGKPEVPAEMAMELKLRIRQLSHQLIDNVSENWLDESVLIVTTFVNLNDLYETSALGRLMSEQLIGELQRAGAEIIDARIATSLQISKGFGEYALSRDMSQLSYIHGAQTVVVGTYSVAAEEIVVNARLLQQEDGSVLSSASIVFPTDNLTSALLREPGKPVSEGSMVPVRSFSDIDPE